jgi:hypothetical protein
VISNEEEDGMTRNRGRRSRLGATWFALALGALALLAVPSLAAARDGNHDGIPDKWEKRHHLSLKVNQAHRNQDGDRLRNRAEFLAGDNPRDADSNDDGVIDGEDNAGTIVSFDQATGKLTIDLFGGETVSGLVGEGTEIKCEDHGGATASRDGSEAGDDNGGEAGVEPGDDNGGQGEEELGDDNGGESSGDNSGPGNTGNDDNEGEAGNCTAADLTPGAVVQEAELGVADGHATFEEVELSGRDA